MDSDSDEEFLSTQPVFSARQTKVAEREKIRMAKFLGACVAESDRVHELDKRVSQIKNTHDIDLDDEELCQRVLTQQEAALQSNSREAHWDAVDGSDDIDPEGVWDRSHRKALAQAFDTDRSSCLGRREIIKGMDPKRAKNLVNVFLSIGEATKELTTILAQLEEDSSLNTIQITALVTRFRAVLEINELATFLRCDALSRLLRKQNSTLPFSLIKWLVRVAFSAGMDDLLCDLGDAVLHCLLTLYPEGRLRPTPLVSFEAFCSALECWVETRLIHSRTSMAVSNCSINKESRKNLNGLRHLLILWNSTLSTTATSSVRAQSATTGMVALALLSIDLHIRSPTRDFDLQAPLQQAVERILNLVSSAAEKGQVNLIKWMWITTKAIISGLENLGPGLKGADDSDDREAWLCRSAVVCSVPPAQGVDQPCGLYKVIVGLQALDSCLNFSGRFPNYIESIAKCIGNQELLKEVEGSVSWKALVAPYAALIEMERQEHILIMDGPRCLAIAECMFATFQAGSSLIGRFVVEDESFEFHPRHAELILHVLDLMDPAYLSLSKRMSSLNNNPFFRRVDFCLSYSRQMYQRVVREAALAIVEEHEKVETHTTMTTFFQTKATTSPVEGYVDGSSNG